MQDIAWISAVLEPETGQIRPEALCQLLGKTPEELAMLAGLSSAALTSDAKTPETQTFLQELVEALALVCELRGEADVEAAGAALFLPWELLGGRRAVEMIAQGQASAMSSYLRNAAEGATG